MVSPVARAPPPPIPFPSSDATIQNGDRVCVFAGVSFSTVCAVTKLCVRHCHDNFAKYASIYLLFHCYDPATRSRPEAPN